VGRPIPTVSHSSPATAAFPMLVQGRRPHWTFRGLLDAHLRYGLSVRCIAKATHLSRRLRRFRYLHHRSDSYWLERPSCQVGIAPTEDQHLSRAHTNFDPIGPNCGLSAEGSVESIPGRARLLPVGCAFARGRRGSRGSLGARIAPHRRDARSAKCGKVCTLLLCPDSMCSKICIKGPQEGRPCPDSRRAS
jgi:hypothetical protein